MSNYNNRLVLVLPAELINIGKSIARALDPDIGGYDSFTPNLVDEAIVSYTADTPCTDEFYQAALYMLEHPQALHQRCVDDYAARWSALTPPTLEDCIAFCSGVTIKGETIDETS